MDTGDLVSKIKPQKNISLQFRKTGLVPQVPSKTVGCTPSQTSTGDPSLPLQGLAFPAYGLRTLTSLPPSHGCPLRILLSLPCPHMANHLSSWEATGH